MEKSNNKKPFLTRIRSYLGRYFNRLYGAGGTAFVASLVGLIPYILLWRIVLLLLTPSAGGAEMSLVVQLAWWVFIAAVAYVVLNTTAMMLSHTVAFRLELSLRYQAMQRLVALPLAFFLKESTGRVRKVIDSNAALIHSFVAHQFPDLISALTTFVAMFVMLFAVDWRMGLISLVPIMVCLMAMGSMMNSSAYRESMSQYMHHLEQMNAEAVEYVRGMPVVKTFQQSVFSFGRFHKAIKDYDTWVTRYAMTCRRPMTWYTVASNSFAFVLLPMALFLLWQGEPMATVLSNLVFYLLVTPFVGRSIMRLSYMISGYQVAEHALDAMEALFEGEAPLEGDAPLAITAPDISLEQVSFRYGGEEAPLVLRDVSLEVPPHQTYALVGASGSGKTTLARLIARFWDPVEGLVRISGTSLKSSEPDSILEGVTMVFQKEQLFKLSIRDNVTYGTPDATDEEVKRALHLAQCDDIKEKLPDGWDTIIGSKGTYLSGGEQQRIVLARAFLRETPLLLLDEATAFADPQNERAIRGVLKTLMQEKTVVMVAHRLSSVVDADCIVVLHEGEVVEQGTHEELLQRTEGRYSVMWKEFNRSIKWTI